MLRDQDRLRLLELHSTEIQVLRDNRGGAGRKVMLYDGDGFNGIKAILPPPPRRALVLIDPSYEDKQDYARTVRTLEDGIERFATGVYAIWYPQVQRRESTQLPAQLMRLPLKSWPACHADREAPGGRRAWPGMAAGCSSSIRRGGSRRRSRKRCRCWWICSARMRRARASRWNRSTTDPARQARGSFRMGGQAGPDPRQCGVREQASASPTASAIRSCQSDERVGAHRLQPFDQHAIGHQASQHGRHAVSPRAHAQQREHPRRGNG